MSDISSTIAKIEALPDGPQIGAFFDFDGTVIAGYSAFAFVREQIAQGHLSMSEFTTLAGAMTNFGLGNMGFSGMMVATSQFLRGVSEQTYIELGETLYQKHIARKIYPEARAIIEAHQAKGHTLAIISSATPYQVNPAAADLGFEHVLCTRLETRDGVFTGGVERPTCFGPGKVAAAELLAETEGVSLADSYFYSDSMDDIELLEHIGHPRPLNPDRKLTRHARDRNWPMQRFSSRGTPGPLDWARSIAATGSLLGAFAASLPIWALTGSRRKAQNFSYSLFADTASALIGMDLEVEDEHNLWVQRPAVFVFNHQSKADVIVLVSLLRRDLAGIGKKELQRLPLLGQALQFGGVVFIDRQNASSAIEAMRPLVDVMRDEGKSVLIAPEGTRSVSPTLGPFKKGAFHLAMQSGVPIVPIVIYNAGDVAPKGEFVFRSATVRARVLAPVQTDSWSPETIDEHVAQVRNLFLEALGQSDEGLDDDADSADAPAADAAPAAKAVRKARTRKKRSSKKKSTSKKSRSADKAAQ